MSVYKKEYFGIARKIVSNMTTESWRSIPHVAATYEADVTELMRCCRRLNAMRPRSQEKITLNTVMLKIICEGLKAAPKMNTTLEFNRRLVRGTLKYHDTIDISMPMVLPSGEMMTVNMRDMGNKSLREMTAAINDTVRRAKNSDMNEVMFEVSLDNTLNGLKEGKVLQTLRRLYGSKMPGKHKVHTLSGSEKKKYYSIPKSERLTKLDIEQGTTTISNIGSVCRDFMGTTFLLEIIPPQTTAFCIGPIQKKPWVVKDENGNDKVEVRQIITITSAIDHRALDFGDCVPMIEKFNEIFRNPEILLSWK